MSDAQAYDDQSLPWLEAVENEEGPRAISARKMLVALLLVLLAGAIVAGTMFWLGRQNPAVSGAPELIRAEPGPYKVKPTDPGGLDVAGDSETAYSTSAGEDPDSELDVRKLPEEVGLPAAEPATTAHAEKPKKIPPNEVKEPAPNEPAAAAAAPSGPTIQLGAYASTVKADTAWKLLSGRFPEVASLRKAVVTATVGGKSIYRLRASGSSDQTRAACAALRAAGESCMPWALKFLLGFEGNVGGVQQEALPAIGNYLNFSTRFLFGFGVAFLTPVLLMVLERAGIVTREQLAKSRRYAIVISAAVSAVLTPPDVVSMLLLLVPLYGLYEFAILAIRLTHWRAAKRAQATASNAEGKNVGPNTPPGGGRVGESGPISSDSESGGAKGHYPEG